MPCSLIGLQVYRKLAKSSLGGKVYPFGELIGHATISREFHAPPGYLSPDMIGFEARGSLSSRLRNAKTVPDKYLVRHFLGIQQALGNDELDGS